ncbi:MAG: hypothetical protein K2X03_14540 [Bryobacteraceae bacterium]|nr:hypothetical protein [Bryobacteraceae bacterium]
MKRLLLACLLALPAFSDKQTVDRNLIGQLEQNCNRRIETLYDDPYMLLGLTRGVYLEGYGVVLSAEVNLAITPGATPFRMAMSDEEKAALRKKKLDRLPGLKQAMREVLTTSAKALQPMAAGEQVVLAITLMNRSFEQTQGLPSQIVMQAPKQSLLTGTPAIQVREY